MIDILGQGGVVVPQEVLMQIKARAASEWPGDYSMQAYTITQQREAYEKIQNYRASLDMENEVVSTCMGRACDEWPEDYTMQVYVFDNQLESAVQFFKVTFLDVPSSVLEEIKHAAFTGWPGDYSMMLYTLNSQVESWREVNAT